MRWELWEFFEVEGLDKRICWGFCGKKMRGSSTTAAKYAASGRDDGVYAARCGRDDGGNSQRQEQTTAKNRQRRRTDNGEEQTTARTDNGKNKQRRRTNNGKNRQRRRTNNSKNKNKQKRNAGVPPLRRQNTPPPVGMTGYMLRAAVGMTAETDNGKNRQR
jgi:hypothetical protein